MTGDDATERFAAARPRLVGVAYRLLGTVADADDVVQEAWLRWQRTDHATIDNPDAWLTTVVTRLGLDRLRQRKRDEERYVGPWLPTPLVERAGDPAASAELAESMTTAFLLLLERLSPDERAAFLLADVFGESFEVIATAMERSEAACRQLASRARRKLRDARQQPPTSAGPDARAVIDRFVAAIVNGDESSALACVAPDAHLISDGGAGRRAARRPVVGADRIVRFVSGLQHRLEPGWTAEPAVVGGVPGLLVLDQHDQPYLSVGFEVADGQIGRVLLTVNPDKLDGVGRYRSGIE
ncbi:RNA polymerase sigma-70 factor [soil metagenome]